MRTAFVVAAAATTVAACERADPSPPPPTPLPKIVVAPSPPPPLPPPPPAPPPTPAPAPAAMAERPHAAPPVRGRILAEDHLPQPPAPDDPAAYARWLAQLARQDRADVAVFCNARPNRWNYHAVCGGIGPYHIPAPPSLAMARASAGDHAAWEAALTPAQRHFYVYWCRDHTDEGEIGFSQLCGGTPLVVAFADPATARVAFTADRIGVTPATPWLARDLDGDGAIDSAAELFGDATALPTGRTARTGFEALAALDANGDGTLDATDPAFAELVLWCDADGDGRGQPGELEPIAAAGITAISLAATRVPHCVAGLGCEGERAAMTFAGRTGTVIDVYFPRRRMH